MLFNEYIISICLYSVPWWKNYFHEISLLLWWHTEASLAWILAQSFKSSLHMIFQHIYIIKLSIHWSCSHTYPIYKNSVICPARNSHILDCRPWLMTKKKKDFSSSFGCILFCGPKMMVMSSKSTEKEYHFFLKSSYFHRIQGLFSKALILHWNSSFMRWSVLPLEWFLCWFNSGSACQFQFVANGEEGWFLEGHKN